MHSLTEQIVVNRGLAHMLKGGVIMDVVDAEQAKIAERAGACAVMALERIPADIRRAGGVARMSKIELIESIMSAVSIPVMAKCRIGHDAEASILDALNVDFIDESEVLTPADEQYHLNKSEFKAPFVCGARDLGEALRRIQEGAAMVRTKGEAGTGNIVEAVRHMRQIQSELKVLLAASEAECQLLSERYRVSMECLEQVREQGQLPVVNFAAGGVATPADAALMMRLGSEGVFVGSGVFKSEHPEQLAEAMVQAVVYYQDAKQLVEISRNLGEPMPGVMLETLAETDRYAQRGD
ncbi:MAG: pyridoxal 5'-phosphate synthase lyase subunit PdxS [Legionellales bacterium]|nr:pyridoxal 5'-phosphate synthase lyase subunit PdxS [Legionellales bacterium]